MGLSCKSRLRQVVKKAEYLISELLFQTKAAQKHSVKRKNKSTRQKILKDASTLSLYPATKDVPSKTTAFAIFFDFS